VDQHAEGLAIALVCAIHELRPSLAALAVVVPPAHKSILSLSKQIVSGHCEQAAATLSIHIQKRMIFGNVNW
ncbi:MAG: hypothetical protein ACRD19_05080, partial [Terriglobia bacterium]